MNIQTKRKMKSIKKFHLVTSGKRTLDKRIYSLQYIIVTFVVKQQKTFSFFIFGHTKLVI